MQFSTIVRAGRLGLVVLTACAYGSALTAQRLEPPATFDVEQFSAARLVAAAESGAPFDLDFFGASHRLLLEPTNLRSSRFRVVTGSLQSDRLAVASPPRTYRGSVEGEPGSIVRMSAGKAGIRGYIKTASGWTFIEPMPPAQAQLPGAHRVFTDGDLDASFEGMCAAPLAAGPEEEASLTPSPDGQSLPDEADGHSSPPTSGASGLRVFEIAVDVDFEYFSAYGENTVAEIESTLNAVDGIYQSELNLTIEIVMIHIWDAEPDPYESTASGTVLQEFRSYWNGNQGGVARDAAHLFTGKNMDGATVGIAYVSVVCSPSVAYSLSQDLSSSALMPILVAHELGHNLGANHDPVESDPRYIMYPSLGLSNLDEFSDLSGTDISDYVDSVSCLALADPNDPGGSDPGNGSGSGNGGGGGGGGGGPVDPLAFLVVGGGLLVKAVASRRRNSQAHREG